jgi:hypothetical protein
VFLLAFAQKNQSKPPVHDGIWEDNLIGLNPFSLLSVLHKMWRRSTLLACHKEAILRTNDSLLIMICMISEINNASTKCCCPHQFNLFTTPGVKIHIGKRNHQHGSISGRASLGHQ